MADSLTIRINGDVKNFQDSLTKVQRQTKDLEGALSGIAKTSSIAFVGLGAAIFGVVKEAEKVETMVTQFEVLTGSVGQAKKVVEDLQKFSASTPFQMEGLSKAASQLLGFGFEADKLLPKLQQIGDVASAVNKPIEEVGFIFGQVAAAGKLTGERLLQFQERAIPIGPAIAKTMGIAESAVRDAVSKGLVDFATFEKAFASLSQQGGFAFEGMIKQSKTFAGVTSSLSDNLSLLAADIGKELLPTFKKLAIAASSGLEFLRSNPEFAKMAATILSVGAALTGVVAVLGFAAVAFLKVRAALVAVQAMIAGMTISIKGLVGATGIGLLILLLTDLALNWERRFAQMQAIFHAFSKNVTDIGQGLAKFFKGVFTLDIDQIKEGYNQVKDTVIQTFDEIASSPAFTKENPVEQFFPEPEVVKEKAQVTTDAILEAKRAQVEQIIAQDEELQAMMDELSAAEKEKKLQELTEQYENENDITKKEIDKRFAEKQKNDQKFLADQKKFGTAYAMINQVMNSEIYKGTKQAFGEMEQMTQSHNNTLKSIGKVAAIANIIIRTAESAMAIYAGFSTIPIIGPALGVAGAAAAVAFGAEQVARVQKANKGLLVQGGIPGVDSVPVMAQQGELIAPTKNFEEVIGSVRAKREAEQMGGSVGGSNVGIHVTYNSPEASQIVTVRQIEDSALGISRMAS